MKTRIIVCGLGRTGYKIFSLLKQQGALVVGISDSPVEVLREQLHGLDVDHEADVVVGDLRSAGTLLAAGVKEAHTLVLATRDDALNLAVLIQARVLNPRIRIISRLFNTSLGDRLDHTLPDHASMSVAALSAPVFAFAAMGNRAIGQLRLFHQIWPIHEEHIDETHPWKGRKLADLWEDRSRMLIYYLPVDSRLDLISAVVEDQSLRVGDRLIVATQPSVRNFRKTFKQKFSEFLLGLRQFQQQVQPTVVVMLVLLATIFGATLTYTAVNLQTTPIDALYFSVGMITGAGGNEGVVEHAPASIKVFTVVMMLVGAAVTGICYALLNDFVLGTRFKQLWNTSRIPHSQHYIICGLDGVGVQIVNYLHANGCEIVVIEPDPNNRFLNVAHSLKVPVIQGDASVLATLESANVAEAEALLAVTSDDVANLEIALTAKGLAPKLPVIVRNQDPQFAPLAQQVFDFEAVLSPAELAAPSFAAAALGGRVLGNGMTADSLWVALATIITPGHPFCGRRVKEAAMTADFVPLYLETRCQTIHGWDLLEVSLDAGDVLYLTVPATYLEQLWRVNPPPLAMQLNY
ncbi:NAD-binding protein [Leptolyngbya sp. FACHB-671]|uniref:potassium channel family protein n=1 Tax=Leptolyngbya sp. FACHB-671 TaxID=2692812 RepID=UPI00168622F1|nr:NAD-binding protein [Leptolyngbya sp. FACHB-671]MBD2071093.1 NAD-binding protein [Leptolyngbya sp. FACHB-671]